MVASTCVGRVAYDFAVEVADVSPAGFPLDSIRLRVNGIAPTLSLFELMRA